MLPCFVTVDGACASFVFIFFIVQNVVRAHSVTPASLLFKIKPAGAGSATHASGCLSAAARAFDPSKAGRVPVGGTVRVAATAI